jgi:hypothetical protein
MAHKDDSAPIQFLQLIWDNASKAGGDSWRRYNASLSSGLSLAITSGMKFGSGDFTIISERYRPEYWMRLGSDDGEGYFREAVLNNNVSAAVAFEKWQDREPFICNGIRTSDGNYFEGERRLFIGAWFNWNGERVCATKFVPEKDSIRACSYVQEKGETGSWWSQSKVLHRYLISRSELLAVRKEAALEKKIKNADAKKMNDPAYLAALLDHSVGQERAAHLRLAGAVLMFWRSDKEGKPCNGGSGPSRCVGMVEEEKGPLVECGKGALHGTMRPDIWAGERLWAVALYLPVTGYDSKYASLKREILAEIKSFPPYRDLIPGVAVAKKG